MERDNQWRRTREIFRSVGEHTKVAGVRTKAGEFFEAGWAAGRRLACAGRALSGRCKKILEFAPKRLKPGKDLREITHGTTFMLHCKASVCGATWGLAQRSQERDGKFKDYKS
jgi:hypothetical protein